MVKISNIKKRAKYRLKRNWGNAWGAVLLYLTLVTLISCTGVGIAFISVFTVGYCAVYLSIIRTGKAQMSELFCGWKDGFSPALVSGILVPMYLFFWSLLFIVPGIIKSFSYAMTPYIILDHPEMTASEAITESRRIMKGHKWRLFCLNLSFIGWHILGILTLGILYIYIIPFMAAANASFYDAIKKDAAEKDAKNAPAPTAQPTAQPAQLTQPVAQPSQPPFTPYVAPVAAAPVQSTYAPAPTEAPVVQSGETAVLAEVEAPVETAEAEVEAPAEVAEAEVEAPAEVAEAEVEVPAEVADPEN